MDNQPKVFISYSWTSEDYKETVLQLAENLVDKGVDVILDRWDLRPGQDRFAFMEQSIDKADKVLVLCDKRYAEKANDREGGVGTETEIITPDVYGKSNQEKFIPVVMEDYKFIPAYLRSRMAINYIKENQVQGFEEILRAVYNQPYRKKPKLGTPPEWIDTPIPVITQPMQELGQKKNANSESDKKTQGHTYKVIKHNGTNSTTNEKAFGADQLFKKATSYNKYLGAYHANALLIYKNELMTKKKELGPDHPSIAKIYDKIAGVYYDRGDYPKALENYKKALNIREKKLGTKDMNTALSYYYVAWSHRVQKHYEESLNYYQKALPIFINYYGKEHPYTNYTSLCIKIVQDSINEK